MLVTISHSTGMIETIEIPSGSDGALRRDKVNLIDGVGLAHYCLYGGRDVASCSPVAWCAEKICVDAGSRVEGDYRPARHEAAVGYAIMLTANELEDVDEISVDGVPRWVRNEAGKLAYPGASARAAGPAGKLSSGGVKPGRSANEPVAPATHERVETSTVDDASVRAVMDYYGV